MQIRPATVDDTDGIEAMVAKRIAWMGERGMSAHPEAAQGIAEQATQDDTPMWVLVQDATVVGCTSAYTESPEWGFTEDERAVPALFLASTWTVPNSRRLGWVLARWALDHSAQTGRGEVRRGTFSAALVRYYTEAQGWGVVRSVERRGRTCTFLTRAAEERPDLEGWIETRALDVRVL